MTDFIMLVALLIVTVISFAVPVIYLISIMLRVGWRLSLIGILTFALTYIVLRWLLFTPVFLGESVYNENLLRITLLSAATGALCGTAKLPAVLLNKQKPISYEESASVAGMTGAGLITAFGGVNILRMFILHLGSRLNIGKSSEILENIPENAGLFWKMAGESEINVLLFGVLILIPTVISSVEVIMSIYWLRAGKYWYPVLSALIYTVCVVPAFALAEFGVVASTLYLLIVMFISLRLKMVCREHYYMYDMIARIDDKKRTGRPPVIY